MTNAKSLCGLLVALFVLSASSGAATADSSEAGRCNGRTAFLLGLVVPGGGQFYVGDRAGGIQAVITDAILIEALRRNDATVSGMFFFVGAVHVVEALFAARECRVRVSAQVPRAACIPLCKREPAPLCLAVSYPIQSR